MTGLDQQRALAFGPFVVDAQGILGPRAPGLQPDFFFRHGPLQVDARLIDWNALRMSARLGRVPFTAEDKSGRANVLAALVAVRAHLEPRIHVQIDPDHAVRVSTVSPLNRPATATGLISTAASFVLLIQPILRLLQENGVACH